MTDHPELALGLDLTGPEGRVERAAKASVEAAQAAEILEPTDMGLAVLAVELARSVDRAARLGRGRDVALLAKELRETAARLRMDPTARGEAAGDAFHDLLAELSQPSSPTLGHPTQP